VAAGREASAKARSAAQQDAVERLDQVRERLNL
jgi:hypothetical protein